MHNRVLFKPFQGPFSKPQLIRIGDFMSYMIMAQYQKTIKKKEIIFSLCEKTHKKFRADILFKNVFDEVYIDYIPVKEVDEIFDAKEDGDFWHRSPALVKEYGNKIIPFINFEKKYYNGPSLNWGKYIVFNPLFSAEYNVGRNMCPNYVNKLILKLYKKFGNKLIVITDKPDLITNKFSQVLVSDDLYTLMYIIGKSGVYIGGDTGFTHFAALSRVPLMITLYGTKYPRMHDNKSFNANPMVDTSITTLNTYILKDNELKKKQTKEILSLVKESNICQ